MTLKYRFWKFVHLTAIRWDETMGYIATKNNDMALSKHYAKREQNHKRMLAKLPTLLK